MHKKTSAFPVILVLTIAAFIGSGAMADDKPQTGAVLSVQPDRKNGIYKKDEKISFKISLAKDGAPVASGRIDYALLTNCITSGSGSVELSSGSASVTTQLPAPGAMMIVATYADGDKKIVGKAGAMADPFEIKPSLPAPPDFDEFWEKQRQKLAAVPMNVKLTKVDPPPNATSGPAIECYDVELDCIGGKPVHGYFAKPVGGKAKSLPAILTLHSAGITDSNLWAACGGAKGGALALDINAHGLPNGQPPDFYNNEGKTELNGYQTKGMDNRETFYFYGMLMRMVRAIDFLTAQPEWDGKTVITSGASQGGAQALIAGGLDKRVTEIRAVVPGFCDITGYLVNRKGAWPSPGTLKNKAEEQAMQYYDACNFAARIKVKTSIEVGLADTTVPATGVLAAYNQLQGPKTIVILPQREHGATHESQQMTKDPDYSH